MPVRCSICSIIGGLPPIAAPIGDIDTHNEARRVGAGGELQVEGGPESTVSHLHDTGLGIGRGDPYRRVLGAAFLLGLGHFGNLVQGGLPLLEALLGASLAGRGLARALIAGSAASWVTASRCFRACCMSASSVG